MRSLTNNSDIKQVENKRNGRNQFLFSNVLFCARPCVRGVLLLFLEHYAVPCVRLSLDGVHVLFPESSVDSKTTTCSVKSINGYQWWFVLLFYFFFWKPKTGYSWTVECMRGKRCIWIEKKKKKRERKKSHTLVRKSYLALRLESWDQPQPSGTLFLLSGSSAFTFAANDCSPIEFGCYLPQHWALCWGWVAQEDIQVHHGPNQFPSQSEVECWGQVIFLSFHQRFATFWHLF